MYNHLEIKNFRGLRELVLESLGRVNLIVGPNNSGKTSLLEALWLFHGPSKPGLTINVTVFRGLEPPSALSPDVSWHTLFHKLNVDEPIEITGADIGGRSVRLQIAVSKPEVQRMVALTERAGAEAAVGPSGPQLSETGPPVTEVLEYHYQMDGEPESVSRAVARPDGMEFHGPQVRVPEAVFLSGRRFTGEKELADRFTTVEDSGQLSFVLESLRAIEPNLESLSLGFVAGIPLVRGDVGLKHPLALPFMGGGMVRVVEVLLAIARAPDGLVMIDEIENGIYYKNLESTWKAIDIASDRGDTQIFATTHSLECVRAAIAAFSGERSAYFRLHRLERKADKLRAVTYSAETADAALDMDLEVR